MDNAMTADLLVTNVRPEAGPSADILIRDGRIAAIGQKLEAGPGVETVDGQGAIAIAPFVEPHVHLDKILWSLPWQSITVPRQLRAMIDNEKAIRQSLPWSVAERAGNLIRQCVACGSTHIRSHVDIDPDYGLSNLHGVLEAAEAYRHMVGVEIVAFPQTGMMINPGTAELMEAAVGEGAAVVGGIDPAGIDGDPRGHLDTIFKIANRRGAKIDIHLHEAGPLGLFEMDMILERTQALGLGGRVVVSHAFCLGDAAPAVQDVYAERLAAAGIGIISSVPGDRNVPPLFKLQDAGVKVAIASDSLRDTWNQLGNGDMLERANLLAYRTSLRTDAELERALALATRCGAELLGLDGYGLKPGCEGSLVLLPGENLAEIVASKPRRALTVKRGRVVARDNRALAGP
jgi:cytosine/adenosine deaminase-related metal-dependent hydrolase